MTNKCAKIWLLGFGFLLVAVAIQAKSPEIVFSDPTKSILVQKSNPVFEIVLQSNPTTGYSWFLKNYDNNLITLVSHSYYPPLDQKLVGAPGYDKWIFRVKPEGFIAPQLTNITLIYMRTWEDQGAQVINFKVVTGLN